MLIADILFPQQKLDYFAENLFHDPHQALASEAVNCHEIQCLASRQPHEVNILPRCLSYLPAGVDAVCIRIH